MPNHLTMALLNRSIGSRVELRLANVITFSENAMRLLTEQSQRMRGLVQDIEGIKQSVGQGIDPEQATSISQQGRSSQLLDIQDNVVLGDIQAQEIEAQLLWQPSSCCSRNCYCACHNVCYNRSPQFLDRLLGVLFWTYTGLAIIKQDCDSSTCVRNETFAIQISYFFPAWYVNKAFNFTCKFTPLGGPQVSLRTFRIVDQSASIFHFTHIGDLNAIKSPYSQRLASSLDVSHKKWNTPLHVSLWYDYFHAITNNSGVSCG